MAIELALPKLFDAVVARFTLEGTVADNDFGWREPAKQKRVANRIVWVPGDESGNAGEMRAARNPGGNPRSIGTLGELFTVRLEAFDSTSPEDERTQYIATRLLFDAWVRAVYLEAHGTFEILSLVWNTEKNQRRHGAELILVCELQAKIPDTVQTLAPVDTGASIVDSELDVDETVTVPAP